MTDVERNAAAVLGALRDACAAHPTQRVAQVIVNALGVDPFYIEDADAAKRFARYAAGGHEE